MNKTEANAMKQIMSVSNCRYFLFSSHCAIEGTSLACDGGGSGGGQLGAFRLVFFGAGFLLMQVDGARGGGVG